MQSNISRVENDNADDFEALFEGSRHELYAFLERRISQKLRRRLDTSDILQETHLASLKQYSGFLQNPCLPPKIWLLKNARQQLIQSYRMHFGSAKRSLHREADWNCSSTAMADAVIASGSSPSGPAQAEELYAKIHSAIEELSNTDQEILLMRHFENRSYEDIAALLELDVAAVRQRFGRALLRLRTITKRLGLLDHLT